MAEKSHFYAYISKLRWVFRWGLKRNAFTENVMEHSWEVATIAHVLALIGNRRFNKNYDAHLVATTALYHDVSEVITGDLPTPIKYHTESMRNAYKEIERQTELELLDLLPADLKEDFRGLMISEEIPEEVERLVKGADTVAAYLKCQEELKAGNQEFTKASEDVAQRLKELALPEAEVFMDIFAGSYKLTLDQLLKGRVKR